MSDQWNQKVEPLRIVAVWELGRDVVVVDALAIF